jgi:regulatory protein
MPPFFLVRAGFMKIESVAKIKNNVKMILDNGEKLFLRYEVFLKNALRKGDDLTEEEISKLIRQNQFYFVKESAFRFLGLRIHSEKELERKLSAKKYDKEIIHSVIKELKDNHYLDDEQFAREFTEEKINKKAFGPNKVKAELKARGVSQEIINSVLEVKSSEVDFENAVMLAEKKLSSLMSRNLDKKKINQRLYAYLLAKGFGYDLIKQVVEKVFQPTDEEME